MRRFFETTCKICKGRVVAQFDDPGPSQAEREALQEAVDRFSPMLVCNPCYDAHDQRQRAGETILDACYSLARVPAAKRTAELKGQARKTLEVAMPAYARAVAQQCKGTPIYDDSAVSLLIERPEKCSEVLRMWRKEIRNKATGSQL